MEDKVVNQTLVLKKDDSLDISCFAQRNTEWVVRQGIDSSVSKHIKILLCFNSVSDQEILDLTKIKAFSVNRINKDSAIETCFFF